MQQLTSFLRGTATSILGLLLTAARILFALFVVLLGSLWRAIVRNATLKKLSKEETALPLLAARLTDLPYKVETAEEIAAGVASLLTDPKVLHFQDQELMQTHAVWYLAEAAHPDGGAERALFLVFRGTNSPTDAITDILIRPDAADNGVECHGGFLRTVREDKTLLNALQQHAVGDRPLFVMGHSLGGALSQTLVGAGLLPEGFKGKVTVVSLGGPVPFFGRVKPELLPEVAVNARVVSIVNSNDIVPRLLGSPLSFSRKLLEVFTASMAPRKRQRNEAVLNTLEEYTGFPQEQLLFVYDGAIYRVPPFSRKHVLHLAEALHPRAIVDHLSYVKAVEAAANATPWVVPQVPA